MEKWRKKVRKPRASHSPQRKIPCCCFSTFSLVVQNISAQADPSREFRQHNTQQCGWPAHNARYKTVTQVSWASITNCQCQAQCIAYQNTHFQHSNYFSLKDMLLVSICILNANGVHFIFTIELFYKIKHVNSQGTPMCSVRDSKKGSLCPSLLELELMISHR